MTMTHTTKKEMQSSHICINWFGAIETRLHQLLFRRTVAALAELDTDIIKRVEEVAVTNGKQNQSCWTQWRGVMKISVEAK